MSSTTISKTPEHLRHHEYEAAPFTAEELAAIRWYEEDPPGNGTDAAFILKDCLDCVDFDPIKNDGGTVVVSTNEQVKAAFAFLTEWHERLDSLYGRLRREYGGPAFTLAAYRLLQSECSQWYRKLHEVRREACRQAYGTAGPQPEMDSGYMTFGDVGGVLLNGVITAEGH